MRSRTPVIAGIIALVTLSFGIPVRGWAQLPHESVHRPPPGATAAEQRFDDIERAVAMFEDPARERWQKSDEVLRQLQLQAGDLVVDIGAGTGYFTRRIAAAVGPTGRVIGRDVEPAMVAHLHDDAAQKGVRHLSARQVPVDDPELAPRSVDVVFIRNTYHHLQDRVAYARLLAQALKAGGRVVIVDFEKRVPPVGPPVAWKLSQQAVTDEFRQAGFARIRALDFLPHRYFLEFTPTTDARAGASPRINRPFLDPALDVPAWQAALEGERREIFARRAAITAALRLEPGSVVADIGAGTGVFLDPFAQALGPDGILYAVEIAPSFVAHLRRRAAAAGLHQVRAVLGDAQHVPLPRGSVDLAFVCDTYHHFEYPQAMLSSLHRALRAGGALVVIDFERVPGHSRQWVLDHVRADKAQVTAEIVAAGFRLAEEVHIPGLRENYFLRFVRL